MEEADKRHSRVNERRKKSAPQRRRALPPLPRQGRDCVAMRMNNPSAEDECPRGQAAVAEEAMQQGEGPRGHEGAEEEARRLRQAEEDNEVSATH